jgi:hypothetical protein
MNNHGRQVQIFLLGDSHCEVNGILMDEERDGDWYHLSFKENDFDPEVYHISIPVQQIRMVRYYDVQDEETVES